MVVKSPFESQVTELLPNQQILRFLPDHHVRKKNGEHQLYVALDKQGIHLIASQKLSLLSEYISKLAGEDRCGRISAVSLYKTLSGEAKGTVNGGYSKMRWKLLSYPLDSSSGMADFEGFRASFKNVTILGSKGSVYIQEGRGRDGSVSQ